jgi:hypothetical protein
MAMTSMKLSKSEAKDSMPICSPDDGDGPAYPYGLCLYLDDETMKKLGITDMPDVGTRLMLHATVEVTSNSQRQTQDGKTVNMDLQITDMELAAPGKSAADRLYGNT